MIRKFSFSNFGPVDELVELDFECRDKNVPEHLYVQMPDGIKLYRLGMVIGPNASGKSTIIEAFDFLLNFINSEVQSKDEAIGYIPFLFKPVSTNSTFNLDFYFNKERYEYSITINNQSVIKENLLIYLNKRKRTIFKRKTIDNVSEIEFGEYYSIPSSDSAMLNAFLLNNQSVWATYNKLNIDIELFNNILKNYFNNYLSPIIDFKINIDKELNLLINNDKHFTSFIQSTLKAADNSIVNFSVEIEETSLPNELIKDYFPKEAKLKSMSFERFLVNFQHQYSSSPVVQIGEEYQSMGTRKTFALAIVFYQLIYKKQGCHFFDEFENELHFDLQKFFLNLFLHSDSETQLFISTHNLLLMNEKELFTNETIWITEKNKNGATELFNLASFGTKNFRKENSAINFYISGKLGGLPNLGSFLIN